MANLFQRHPQEWAEATICLTSEQGFPLYLAHSIILRGWALARQGQRAAAHQLLAAVYGWFTEGFDTLGQAYGQTEGLQRLMPHIEEGIWRERWTGRKCTCYHRA